MAEERSRPRRVRNRVVPAVVAGLVVLFVIIALLTSKEEKKPAAPVETGTRALVLSDDARAREVVIPPCGAPLEDTTRKLEAGDPIPTAVTLALAPDRGERTLLVPKCNPASATGAGSPAAAYLLPVGKRGEPGRASRLVLPAGSDARTIVVPRCTTGAVRGGEDFVLREQAGERGTVIAPTC